MDRPGFVNSITTSLSSLSVLTPSSTLRPSATAVTVPTVLPLHQNAKISAPNLDLQLTRAFSTTGHLGDNALGKGTGTVIVLFRSDLRLDDHPALSHALEEAAHIIPLFVFDPRHFGRTAYGFEKTGKYRANFLLESIADLRKSLQKIGSDLIIRTGHPEKVVPDLCKRLSAKQVYIHREVTYEEQKLENDLAEALKKNNASLQTFWASTLYHEDDLPFHISSMPDVYSDFRQSVEKDGIIRTPLPVPDKLSTLPRSLDRGEIPTLAALGIRDVPDKPSISPASGISAVSGGETEAMCRVHSYVKDANRVEVDNSPRARVTAHLGADFSVRISPWLALGCVSPRRIFEEMKTNTVRAELLMQSSTYYELVWRDFFRCITTKYARKRSSSHRGATAKSLTAA